jgi:amidase
LTASTDAANSPAGRQAGSKRFACDALHFTYDARHRPIGEVTSGESFEIETADCFSGRFQEPADFTAENIAFTRENLDGVSGPVRVAGAAAGDALAVTIHSIAITTPGSVVFSRCEAVSPRDWWDEEFSCDAYQVEQDELVFSDRLRIPVAPMIGCIATAPAREVVLSVRGGPFGGNMDCADVAEGATVVLPVDVDGGLLYVGDCKARMGAGEIVQPPEVGTLITASAEVRSRPPSMRWPRVETATKLITVVTARAVDYACEMAFKELLAWIQDDYPLDRVTAAQLMGITADVGVCQLPNALPTAKCSIERRWVEP